MDIFLSAIASRARRANPPVEGDYQQDGLLYCGKCHTPKQCRVTIPEPPCVTYTMPCMCQCRAEACKRERQEKVQEVAQRLRERGGISPECTFEAADESKPLVTCQRYAERWSRMRQENAGLLLWGGVGSGKTFAAQCIANALIGREQPVSVFFLPVTTALQGGFDKTVLLRRIHDTGLMILDDLGAERGSTYAIETVFSLFDERYRAKQPMIVTTNLTLEEMKNPVEKDALADLRRKRIYDRVLESCVPVFFGRESRRKDIAARRLAIVAELLAE